MEYRYQIGNVSKTVRVERKGEAYHVSIDGAPFRVVRVTRSEPNALDIEMDGVRRRVHIVRDGQRHYVALGSEAYALQVAERSRSRKGAGSAGADAGQLEAAMPGQVVSVAVREGDEVTKGQMLVILEAMKMENEIASPKTGIVKEVYVKPGALVKAGEQLCLVA